MFSINPFFFHFRVTFYPKMY
ncbi:MAG: hypothetical protein JWQ30_411, partial [Sediminibacterium sp.]|nr:hypothetical protein [Sediminibacterium sp.]